MSSLEKIAPQTLYTCSTLIMNSYSYSAADQATCKRNNKKLIIVSCSIF